MMAFPVGDWERENVWLNRRSPVSTPERRRKWQELYHCHCSHVWGAWSNDRPPTDLSKQNQNQD